MVEKVTKFPDYSQPGVPWHSMPNSWETGSRIITVSAYIEYCFWCTNDKTTHTPFDFDKPDTYPDIVVTWLRDRAGSHTKLRSNT